MGNGKFAVGDAVRFGWETTKKNLLFLAVIMLALWVVSLISQSVVGLAKGNFLIFVMLWILSFIIDSILTMGVIRIMLKFHDNQAPAIPDIISCYPLVLNYIGAFILFWIISAIGLILLILPGLYLMLRLQFFAYFVVDKNKNPIEAIKASWEATAGSELNLLVLWFASLGIVILGVLALFVGLLAAIPVVLLAVTFVYRRLSWVEAPIAALETATPRADPVAKLTIPAAAPPKEAGADKNMFILNIDKKTLIIIILSAALAIIVWARVIGPFFDGVIASFKKPIEKKIDAPQSFFEQEETGNTTGVPQTQIQEIPTQAEADESFYRKLADAVSEACTQEGIQFENLGIDENSLIVVYRDSSPSTPDLITRNCGFLMGLCAGLIKETTLKDRVDTLVLKITYSDGMTYTLTVLADDVTDLSKKKISDEELKSKMKIEPC